jgi:hypothetical protein
MTGKRPRAFRRTSSGSIIESESFTHEFSPLLEHPKEKPKQPTLNESVPAPPRLVIGFDPKPALSENGNGDVAACWKPPPSPSNGEKSPSQRSGLESLLSVPRESRKAVNEVAGLGIVQANMHSTVAQEEKEEEELKIDNIVNSLRTTQSDHVAPTAIDKAHPGLLSPNPCYNAASSYQPQALRQFSPMHHAPGPTSELDSGLPASSQHSLISGDIHPLSTRANGEDDPAMLSWLRPSDYREADCDAGFLLRASAFNAHVHVVPDVAASAAAAVHFLDACYFCKRHLVDGKDIYMYRGDKAFCSTECRSQQILLDERRENCSVAARKKPSGAGAPSSRRRSGDVAARGIATAA